jgi:2-methylcitrate synthase
MMSENQEAMTKAPRKKSVALSGVVAGQTAICTVGANGNELHYRGFEINDLAEQSTFEEVAHLLIHEELPNSYELERYRLKLETQRGLPAPLKTVLEQIPAAAQPMDVLRTGGFHAGHSAPRARGSQSGGGAQRSRSHAGFLPHHAGVLVPLCAQRQAHRYRYRLCIGCRIFLAPVGRP